VHCSIVNDIDRKVTYSMRNKTFLEDFEMAEIGKVSATLAKLLQLLVRSSAIFLH
jgi:callose synthase